MLKRRRVRRETLLTAGQTLGGRRSYRVGRLIGAGAFALVYRGEDEAGRPVAIKEYRAPLNRGERQMVERMWRQEVETLQAISGHRALAGFREAFSAEGREYVIQEYLAGESLAAVLEREGVLGEARVVAWGREICEALAYMHEQGVVHHDLKPENVIIRPDGRVALLDLGSAQWLGREVGDLHGSDGYLAPEIRRMAERQGLEVHPGTDVFALGIVLYEALVGHQPSQEHIDGCSVRLVGPLLHRLSRFDAGLVQVIVRAISYDADYRYQSAPEMLEGFAASAPAVPRVEPAALEFPGLTGRERGRAALRIRNAGGGTLEAVVAAAAPWLRVGASALHEAEAVAVSGNDVTITASALAEAVPRGERPARGWLEVRSALTTLRVPCAARVERAGPMIQAYYPALFLRARRGQHARGAIGVRNTGDEAGEVVCRCQEGQPVEFRPETFVLQPMQARDVGVTVDTRRMSNGGHTFRVTIEAGEAHRAEVDVHVDVFSGPVRRLLRR